MSFEKTTIVIDKTTRSIEKRLEDLSNDLSDLGLTHTMDQLIIKNPDEFLLLREYRAMRLNKMRQQAIDALRQSTKTMNPNAMKLFDEIKNEKNEN